MKPRGQPSIAIAVSGLAVLSVGLHVFATGELRGFGVGEAKYFIGAVLSIGGLCTIYLGIR
jgi:hypothetical protein